MQPASARLHLTPPALQHHTRFTGSRLHRLLPRHGGWRGDEPRPDGSACRRQRQRRRAALRLGACAGLAQRLHLWRAVIHPGHVTAAAPTWLRHRRLKPHACTHAWAQAARRDHGALMASAPSLPSAALRAAGLPDRRYTCNAMPLPAFSQWNSDVAMDQPLAARIAVEVDIHLCALAGHMHALLRCGKGNPAAVHARQCSLVCTPTSVLLLPPPARGRRRTTLQGCYWAGCVQWDVGRSGGVAVGCWAGWDGHVPSLCVTLPCRRSLFCPRSRTATRRTMRRC